MELAAERPTVAEIDLDALRANFRALRAIAPAAEAMAVLKADAYGHGAIPVARALAHGEGCRHFGVATLGEARELRRAGIGERIYVMAGFFADQAAEIVSLDLTPFLIDSTAIAIIDAAVRSAGRRAFPVQLKIDTGATRLGVSADDLDAAIEQLRAASSLKLEGVCTLLANAGDPASPITERQLEVFARACNRIEAAGFVPAFAHVANSAATVLRPGDGCNMVRFGLALFGLPPVPAVREKIELRPVMTFRTRLMLLKHAAPGTGVSYGHTFVTTRPSVIGVLPVGYADGYRRGLQHGGEVIVRGRRAPVVGAVCMDLTMIDLTDVPGAQVGDDVILWGGTGEAMISVNDVARLVQTISYEMLCTVGRRVPRVYKGQQP